AGSDGRVILRVKGTTVALPCQYDFLAADRVLVLRPVTPLQSNATASFEVVLLSEARDCDGVRFEVATGGTVLAEFQVNQDVAITDGRILALCPRDNQQDFGRESACVVVFDRPANAASIVAANLNFAPAGGAVLNGTLELPLDTVGVPDGRVVQFRPQAALAASTDFDLTVTDGVTFGQDGTLDFRGRTPFATFSTVAPAAPTAVTLANPSVGFDDKINRSNVGTVVLRVTTPADAQAGDKVRARIYGGDITTSGTGDLRFLERTADVPGNGVQTIDVDFTGALGTAADPELDDGDVDFAAQLQRGSQYSTWIQQASSSQPRFDVTPPTLTAIGPPASTDGLDLRSDLEYVAVYGRASERLASATLADGVNPVLNMFASSSGGRFVMLPANLGRLLAPRPYTLTMTDAAGNLATATVAGNLVQRGVVTGTLTDTLTIEAYDEATLAPVANATVLVDPATPTVPATGQLVGTTDATGRAVFTALVPAQYTVTIVRAGYDLVTAYARQAAFMSLPLVSSTTSAATATMKGAVAFTPGAGVTAIVGNTAVADRSVSGVRTTNAAPNTIPDTAIVPNRLQCITGFAGTFEPTAAPEFSSHGAVMLGTTLLEPSPPGAPTAPGAESSASLALLPSAGQITTFASGYTWDLAAATGLDTSTLVGGKVKVRTTLSLFGFGGQALAGIGFATNPSGTNWSVTPSYSTTITAGLLGFSQALWSVVDAQDGAGRVSRTRELLAFPIIFPSSGPRPLPEITPPGGPITTAPAVTFVDGINAAATAESLAGFDVTAVDANGRRWRLLAADRDGVGGTDTVQFPDVVTAGAAGLAVGNWSVVVEGRLWFTVTGSTADDCVLGERVRLEVNYARGAATVFTVQ
ncbi:MAG: hypothetical protein JNK15_09480, partial [Planctomycetes bacterium]|nr:hypothetical protein [Planctomycetota bacterium]